MTRLIVANYAFPFCNGLFSELLAALNLVYKSGDELMSIHCTVRSVTQYMYIFSVIIIL